MSLSDLKPNPPRWALAAGLPRPRKYESFRHYVGRLGLDADLLLEGLDDRTAVLANIRLASRLQIELPHEFDLHVQELASKWDTPFRRKQVEAEARRAFGDKYRQPSVREDG